MRFLVVGAGVIGQVYAGRLAAADQDVTVLARGARAEELRSNQVRLVNDGVMTRCPVNIVTAMPLTDVFDCVVLGVRFDQLDLAIEGLAMSVLSK